MANNPSIDIRKEPLYQIVTDYLYFKYNENIGIQPIYPKLAIYILKKYLYKLQRDQNMKKGMLYSLNTKHSK